MSGTTKLLVPIPEARQDWLGGIGNTTIYDLINKGELKKVNIGRRSFITSESLAAYVDRLSEVPFGGAAS
jgi:predicted DNA-binding transcriptional regulator AlpA